MNRAIRPDRVVTSREHKDRDIQPVLERPYTAYVKDEFAGEMQLCYGPIAGRRVPFAGLLHQLESSSAIR